MTPPGSDPLAWLETDAIRRASDIALGVILLIAGVFALWYSADYAAGSLTRVGPGPFPALAAGLLCVVAVVLLARAALRRSPPVRRSRPLYTAIVAAAIVVLVFAAWRWGVPQSLLHPAEIMALIALVLALATALAHSSRTRAAGMALLGLLLSIVGTDPNSGIRRFTMGMEALSDGIGEGIVLVGLFVVGDALVCLVSPALFLRTYTRLFTAWRASRIPLPVALVMRLAAALVLAYACYYEAYALSESYVDVASILVFGILGAAAKIFGWNRFLLFLGFGLGGLLDENIRRAMLLALGDPSALLRRPISGTLLVAAIAVIATVAVFSVRRAARAGNLHPAPAEPR